MADSISFIGAKTVRNQTGNQITLLRPKRGGDTHRIKSWWHKGRNAVYIDCALFQVELDNGTYVQLALPLAETTRVKFTSVGDGNFTFNKDFIGLDRAAVIDPVTGELIYEYQFPKISGGSILKRTVGTLPTPAADPVVFTGFTTLTGTAQVGEDVTITAATYTGGDNVSAVQVQLQKSANGTDGWAGFSSWENSPATVTLGQNVDGEYARGVTRVIDDNGTSTKLSENVVGPIAAAAFATALASATASFAVTVVDDNGSDVYALDGSNQINVNGAANETIHFDLSDASNSGHTFKIYADAGRLTEVTVGIAQEGTDLLFTPPITGTFYYACAAHAGMGGVIVIS